MSIVHLRGIGIRVREDHLDKVSLIWIYVILAGERL